jgi:arsenate reductase
MNKTRVLFLCTGNTARSQMAEALLRHLANDRFEVYSAGLEPGVLNPLTVQVIEEMGIDMHQQYAKGLETYLGKLHFGYLITVCAKAEDKCPIFPGMGIRLHWPFDDPAAFSGSEAEKLAFFRQVRDQIAEKIQAWIAELS